MFTLPVQVVGVHLLGNFNGIIFVFDLKYLFIWKESG